MVPSFAAYPRVLEAVDVTPIARSLDRNTNAELAELTKLVQLRGNTPPHLSGLLEVVRERLLKEKGDGRHGSARGIHGGGGPAGWY
jgi:hypothetical protein